MTIPGQILVHQSLIQDEPDCIAKHYLNERPRLERG